MAWSKKLAILTVLGLVAGCGKPKLKLLLKECPSDTGALRSYDGNKDGKADFFLLTGTEGRVDRLAYDLDHDGKPDRIVDLKSIPDARRRQVVIILDGFSHDVVADVYKSGRLRVFHPPSRVVVPYPVMTDLCLADALASAPCRAFQSRYYDHKINAPGGGVMDYLRGVNEPYTNLLTYRAAKRVDGMAYFRGETAFVRELNAVKKLLDKRKSKETVAYLVTSAAVSTQTGRAGQVRSLEKLDRLIAELLWETQGMVDFTLLSDHGHSYRDVHLVDLKSELQAKGWRRTKRLKEPKDVNFIELGMVTIASVSTLSPKALAVDLVDCSGVDLASCISRDDVIVYGRDGGKAVIRCIDGRYAYVPQQGDPLQLNDILKGLTDDVNNTYDADELLHATLDHIYPAPLQRIWRAHFGIVENPPDVIASLDDDVCFGLNWFAELVDLRSTHGNLKKRNSVTFIMSSKAPLPAVLRSREIPAAMSELFGSPWPSGR